MNITIKDTLALDIIDQLSTTTNELGIVPVESLEIISQLKYILKDKSNSQMNDGLNKAVKAILKRTANGMKPALTKCTEEDGRYYVSDSYIALCMRENVLGLELYTEPDKITWKNIFKDFMAHDEEFEIDLAELETWLAKARKEKKKAIYTISETLAVDCGMLKEAILATGNTTVWKCKSMLKINSEDVRALVCGMRPFTEAEPKTYSLIAK